GLPVPSPVKASCAKNHPRVQMASVAKLRRRTFQEVDCRRDVEKKSHPRGVEHDGLGHSIGVAMTSPRLSLGSPVIEPKKPRPAPRDRGFFLSADEWPDAQSTHAWPLRTRFKAL